MSQKLLCLDAHPTILNAFDFSVAPPLLFYSYIPIVLILLFLSIFVIRNSGFSLQGKIFAGLGVSFIAWVINILLQWTAVEANIVYFAWQITALIEVFIPISTLYFVYVFIRDQDVNFWLKSIFAFLIYLTALFLPSSINMYVFDLVYCEALVGPLVYWVYALEIIVVLWVIILTLRRYFSLLKEGKDQKDKSRKILLVGLSSALFLFVFALSNLAGELTGVYSINLFGPIGMVIFLGVLSYSIVKYQAFNVKLLATRALVWGLSFLIGAQFFFIRNPVNYILNGFTFIASIIFGNFLIDSVKREVAQREKLIILLKERESLEHLISHKVKGSFTRSKFVFAEMLAGSFGELNEKMHEMAQGGLDANNSGIKTVDLILNSFNLQSGSVKFEMQPFDFKDIVLESVQEKRGAAEAKGLSVQTEIEGTNFPVVGDAFWLKEVVNNLLENATRYTLHGFIKVSLKKEGQRLVFAVSDSGVGVTEEDKQNLFKQGGRGKDSVKINTDSTGYGLYSVKMILDAHKGTITVDSEGKDKGSTFTIGLDLIK